MHSVLAPAWAAWDVVKIPHCPKPSKFTNGQEKLLATKKSATSLELVFQQLVRKRIQREMTKSCSDLCPCSGTVPAACPGTTSGASASAQICAREATKSYVQIGARGPTFRNRNHPTERKSTRDLKLHLKSPVCTPLQAIT